MELLFAPLDMELVLGVQLAANNTLLFLMLLLFSLASLSNEFAELLTGTLGGRGAGGLLLFIVLVLPLIPRAIEVGRVRGGWV